MGVGAEYIWWVGEMWDILYVEMQALFSKWVRGT